MARLPLVTNRPVPDGPQAEAFDWIVASRGKMIRPYEVLLHVPALARPAAELGHVIRFEGTLRDHDRELAILTVAASHGCAFEWDSHVDLARSAGVREAAIGAVRSGAGSLDESERVIVDFVTELCAGAAVSDATYAAAASAIGETGVVELSALAGYYTFLSYVMGATGAC
ncbi:MAG TPA: carboxymuconolactone decarboxylase family protein [Acidimicrobiia bacterium]|jgi:4-carboxymuconolactone decarboxylase